ncbi:MAG TPA: FAD-binding oxidoreductase [Actinomycetota bacterium]|nr:FAD-binding oxidoreductase [Actinomycetota bacterium]
MNADRRHPAGFWLETCGDDLTPRPPLPGDETVDVAIAGAGFTGLWTAYYLAKADPSLRIVVLEKDVAGWGASGRNGGWCSADLVSPPEALASRYGVEATVAMQRAMFDTVPEIGRACEAEDIDAHFVQGGSLKVATSPLAADRLREDLERVRPHGWTEEDRRWVDAGAARERIDVAGCLGATYTPHCAAVQPARLARGLARTVEALGVRIHEGTAATAIRPGRVRTERGTVRADIVVRALEGQTGSIQGHARLLLAMHIHMGVTEPLPEAFWDEVGWRHRETLSELRQVYVYAQRTRDDRIAFGLARGHPHPGWLTPTYIVPTAARALRARLAELFPAAAHARIDSLWSGYIGMSRDWFPSVGLLDGIAWAGGYFGDGVSTANLAGRTLAELITGRETQLSRLPWVGHRWRPWEPQALAMVGTAGLFTALRWADAVEARTGRPSRVGATAERLLPG